MADSSRFIRAMQKVSAQKEHEVVGIVFGEVTSIEPLKILADEVELTETFLIVGALCKETTIELPEHKHNVNQLTTSSESVGSSGTHSHTISPFETEDALPNILLWRGLEVGDTVILIRMANSQQYFVLQRKEGIA